MSGGHWNYSGLRLEENLLAIGEDPHAMDRWPYTTAILRGIGGVIYDVEHRMDWVLSCDTSWHPDQDKEMADKIMDSIFESIMEALNKGHI